MLKFLLRLWRRFPLWMHILAARLVHAKFRVGVAAMIFDKQGRILLFRHTYRKFEWGIPGGGLEYGEQPEAAVVREVFEETGLHIAVQRLLLADGSKFDHHVSLIYLCELVDGVFRESNEISQIKFFDVSSLPPMLFAEKDMIHAVADILHIASH